jgi:hypothetical protein
LKPIYGETCVDAWLQACDHLLTKADDHWRDYNVILEIADPPNMPPNDHAAVRELDRFLVEHGGLPFNTVVNTIFPAQLYQRYGAPGVYERYMLDVYPQVKKHPDCSWGTYAQRIICRTDGAGTTIHPLHDLVEKLKTQLKLPGPNRAVYELGTIDLFFDIPIYDPGLDRTRPIGGPCLSHLTFKLDPDHRLNLTALYRSHYYVQRALGNLFGLAHLQHFVAQEAKLKIGILNCISSVAQLELSGTRNAKWGKAAVTELLTRCHAARHEAAA